MSSIPKEVLANKSQRFINFCIDFIVRMVIFLGIGIVIGIADQFFMTDYVSFFENMNRLQEIFIELLLVSVYYLLMEILTARTIGKYITGTMVVDQYGNKATSQHIALRTLCRFVPFDPLSFLGQDGSGWHDKWSKTLVIDVKKFNEDKRRRHEFEELGVSEE
ncbi:MAG: RDD family protein [Flavobacterium sp.]